MPLLVFEPVTCAWEAIGVRTGTATSAAMTNVLLRRIKHLLEPFTRLRPAAQTRTDVNKDNTYNIGL